MPLFLRCAILLDKLNMVKLKFVVIDMFAYPQYLLAIGMFTYLHIIRYMSIALVDCWLYLIVLFHWPLVCKRKLSSPPFIFPFPSTKALIPPRHHKINFRHFSKIDPHSFRFHLNPHPQYSHCCVLCKHSCCVCIMTCNCNVCGWCSGGDGRLMRGH